ncbi:MAG: DNA polymerase I [Planctomycetota bacterium]
MAKRLFLIDGTALAYRSYFAFANSPRTTLTTRSGHPTGATYGFLQTLRALLQREQPDALAIAFDGPRKDLHRTAIYPEYKSTRQKMPDEMAVQLDDIRAVVDAFGITVVEADRDEADDVIGTLAVAGRDADMEVYVVTGDKDFLQLVDGRVRLWNLRSSTSKPEILGPAEAEQKWGVPPARMVDLLALMGDSSDNVPGVPKVGEKTAVSLLQEFGTLDQILARAAEVKRPAIRASLQEHTEQALLSRQLVTIKTDVALPIAVTELGPARPDPDKLRALYQRLEFDSLLASVAETVARDEVTTDYRVVRDGAELEALLAALRHAGAFGIATESTGAGLHEGRLIGLAVSTGPGHARYVALDQHPPLLPGGRDAVLAALRPVLEDAAVTKVAADTKRELGVLRRAGVDGRGFLFDTTLASYCLEPGVTAHDLGTLALREFGVKKTARRDLLGSGKKQKTFDEIDPDAVAAFAGEDADLALRTRERLAPRLVEHEVEPLFRELELPLVPVLLDMEWEGITIDTDHLQALSKDLDRRIRQLEERVHQRAGREFNLGSPQQVGLVLFDELEVHRAADVARPRRTATGQYKTDHDVLEKMAPHHEVPALLLEWRMLTKLKGTYVDSLPQMVSAATGRVHTTFNQAVAATGRLSSDNPNLQNIPIRTEEGRKVRAAFVARARDWVLLSADYSQIELRILAHMSKDKALVESFQKGEDIHARTAALVHGLLPDMVTPELRNQAKVINYGLMYGMGPSRLGNETGMRPPEARKFIDSYFRALPGVKRYLDQSLELARTQKFARTLFGRRRPLPEIDSTNAGQRIAAENMAVNTPIQGTAADIVKRAMLAVHAELGRRGLRARLLLQVHDELVLDVPQGELAEVQELVRTCMRGAADLAVPLDVSIGTGSNWLAAH